MPFFHDFLPAGSPSTAAIAYFSPISFSFFTNFVICSGTYDSSVRFSVSHSNNPLTLVTLFSVPGTGVPYVRYYSKPKSAVLLQTVMKAIPSHHKECTQFTVGTTPIQTFFLNSSSFKSARSSPGPPVLTFALASTTLTFKICVDVILISVRQ